MGAQVWPRPFYAFFQPVKTMVRRAFLLVSVAHACTVSILTYDKDGHKGCSGKVKFQEIHPCGECYKLSSGGKSYQRTCSNGLNGKNQLLTWSSDDCTGTLKTSSSASNKCDSWNSNDDRIILCLSEEETLAANNTVV